MLSTKDRMLLDGLIANLQLASTDCRRHKRKTIQKQTKEITPYSEEKKQWCRDYYQKNKKRKQTQALMQYEANREEILAGKKKKYRSDKSFRENMLEYSKKYHEEHKEHYARLNKEWREKNRERYNAYMREYNKKRYYQKKEEAKCLQS